MLLRALIKSAGIAVMLIGDSLNDFDLTEQKLDPTVSETADKMQSMFGRKYILIPNLLNMPEIRASHRRMVNNDDLNIIPPQELAKLRIQQTTKRNGW